MLARPQHNEPLRESFESFETTHGFTPAFIKRVQSRRREEKKITEKRLDLLRKIGVARRELRLKKIDYSLAGIPAWIRDIIREEAAKIDVEPEALLLNVRANILVEARDAAIYRTKAAEPKISMVKIGKWFGNRDHTTCLAALTRYAEKHGLPPLTSCQSYTRKLQNGREAHHRRKNEKGGFSCAHCGSIKIKVVDSRKHESGFRRVRQCIDCHARFRTIETVCAD